ALALRHYLVRTGQRTEAQIRAYEGHVFGKRWSLPFFTVRQMTLYGALQEMTTFVSYKKQEQAAELLGDELLVAIYRTIGRDEMAHCGFYANAARLMLAEDPDGTKADLAHVFRNFKMPAADLLPEWSTHLASMQAAGLDRGSFFREVWLPLLRRLGLTRREVSAAGAVQASNR
ncbi:MAG: acyl-ACP desaturase, partial [Polyangiaceae bacterium]